jgi:histidinol-phosphate aminotransferase
MPTFFDQNENVEEVYGQMLEEEILTSRRDPAIPGCIRINIGNRQENEKLINLLKNKSLKKYCLLIETEH